MIVTRFAPSPTGYLHIGGARTALFNYLFAKHNGGEYKLRIEDTDQARNTPEAVDAIFKGLNWLGIKHDGEPVLQSLNAARHREVANTLIERGAAYRDYTTPGEIEFLKDEWRKANPKAPFRHLDNYWRDNIASGKDIDGVPIPHVVRLKAPREGETVINDLVQGRVAVQNHTLDDLVLLRTDGTPTYMLAVVVDDHDMGVTHVIRGDDHLSNAFRQLPIYHAMGWPEPAYGHLPLILNEKGTPLSKRDGVAGVEDYEADYLPEALFNYLLRLGWGHGDDEIISHDQAVEWFDIADVGKAPARIDPKKLLSVNAHYIQTVENTRLLSAVLTTEPARFIGILPEIRKRAKTLSDIRKMTAFIDQRPAVAVDPLAREIATSLAVVDWNHDALAGALNVFADTVGLKLGKVAGVVRVACTGEAQHIGVYDILLAMGREESLARLMA